MTWRMAGCDVSDALCGGVPGVRDQPLEGMGRSRDHCAFSLVEHLFDFHFALVPAAARVGLRWHCLDWGETALFQHQTSAFFSNPA
jgi:hypothetical protein